MVMQDEIDVEFFCLGVVAARRVITRRGARNALGEFGAFRPYGGDGWRGIAFWQENFDVIVELGREKSLEVVTRQCDAHHVCAEWPYLLHC